jgi:hypothetical protein
LEGKKVVWKNYYNKDNSETKTEWNGNILTIARLHKLFEDCNNCAILSCQEPTNIMQHKVWREKLRCVLRELIPKLRSKDIKKINKLMKCTISINRILEYKQGQNGMIPLFHKKQFNFSMELLRRIDTELRILADKKGMGMTNMDDEESMF